MRQDEARRELVELHAGDLLALPVAERRVLDERALDAVDGVAAGAVGDQVVAVVGEQVVEQVGRGGLAVGAGHEHHVLGLAYVGEKRRIDLLGDDAGQLAALAPERRQCAVSGLADAEGNTEPQVI